MPSVSHPVTRSLRHQHPKPGHPFKEHTGPLSVVAGWRAGPALNYMGSVADLGVQKGCTLVTPWFPCGLGPSAVSPRCPCGNFFPGWRGMRLVSKTCFCGHGRNSKLFILTHLESYAPSDQAAFHSISSTKPIVYFNPLNASPLFTSNPSLNRHSSLVFISLQMCRP